ncbi:CDK-activating kinase assembly factor MAT1-like isoform 1-T2 [Salvelinus alpinus]|uniref:CDK-activating kinase assembly factor MAT1-like isoform X2 n=1 Tax=Salvelinus alpinus TaxID=8036 RepID=UPI0039FDC9BF
MTIWSKWRRSVVPNPISSICPRSIEGKSVLVSWRAALHSIPVYNLTNNLEVEGTKHIMEAYQRENRDIIQKNKAKLMREQEELLSLEELLLEDMLLEELLLLEEQGNEYRRLEDFQEEQRQLQAKRKSKQALLDKLDRAAQLETQIEKQKQVVKTTIFSTGIPMGQTVSLQPVSCIEDILYCYQPINSHTYRTPVPELEQLGRLGYLNHVRIAQPQDMAGGYNSGLVCH